MPLYGYARVSTLDQDLSIQRTALKAAGYEVIRAEKASDGRSELQVLLDFLRAGDTLVVTATALPARCRAPYARPTPQSSISQGNCRRNSSAHASTLPENGEMECFRGVDSGGRVIV
jgi:Resolvase, N terminal domain